MSEWKKVKIGDVCKIVKGTTGIASAEPGKYPLVVTAVERKTCSTYQFDCEAVCIPLVSSSGHGKKSLNNVHYQSGKFALGTILCAVIPNNSDELDARYLHQYLQFYKDTVLVPLMKGAANVSLSMKDIACVEVPLPPIEKQRELSTMFVSLQEKSLEFKKETDKQIEYVKLLRQNILQEAIEGKLTADWRKQHPVQKGNSDYDAEALFEKIQTEKQEKGKKQKLLPVITETEKLFAIPTGWKWVRFGDVIINRDGERIPLSLSQREKLSKKYDYYGASGIIDKVDNYLFDKSLLLIGEDGANLINRSTPIAFIASGKYWVNNHAHVLDFDESIVNMKYIMYHINAINLEPYVTGSAQPKMNQANMNKILIAFPSLAEQKEIVARIEAKLQTITQLETQIATRETTTKQLMQSILKDAFEEG